MSRNFDEWMQAYGRDHKNPTNKLIHKFCVPLILFSVLGLLWLIPIPGLAITYLNVGTVVAVAGLLFYLTLSRLYFALMFIKVAVILILINFIAHETWFLSMCVIIFILAWIGQFIGHKVEGQKPSFLEDIVFLAIGPLWVIRSFIEKK